MLKRENIRIRDPFILADEQNGCYYMYGTTALADGSLAAAATFSAYRTCDLENFDEPVTVFDGAAIGFWADRDFWAPEVHRYGGRYYLLGSCKAADKCRATHVFVADDPLGPFVPVSDIPATPADWECLDGTLWIEDGVPYLVFSHEWQQVKNGEICAVRMADDLTRAIGEPTVLFRAAEATGVSEWKPNSGVYVTDGPFLFRESGHIKMIWSSFYLGRYLVLEAESDRLFGEWRHLGSRFDFDGGHAMVFTRFDGERMIALHRPNTANDERATFMAY